MRFGGVQLVQARALEGEGERRGLVSALGDGWQQLWRVVGLGGRQCHARLVGFELPLFSDTRGRAGSAFGCLYWPFDHLYHTELREPTWCVCQWCMFFSVGCEERRVGAHLNPLRLIGYGWLLRWWCVLVSCYVRT